MTAERRSTASAAAPAPAAPFRVTVRFDDVDGGTRVTLRTVLALPEECARVKAFGAVEGGRQTLRRLAEYLATL